MCKLKFSKDEYILTDDGWEDMGNSESSSCEEETAEEEEAMDQETIDMFVSGIGRLNGRKGVVRW